MKILVTGIAGFIGSHLAERLVGQDLEVVGIDNLSSGIAENLSPIQTSGRFSFIKGDILDRETVLGALHDVDTVFHMAAQSSVPRSTEDPLGDFEVNVRGTLNVLECAMKAEVEKVIFGSSSTVYGEASALPTPEDHPLSPISNYGASKMAAEAYCTSYSSLYGLRTAILRYYNIFGPRSRKGVMFDLMRKLQEHSGELKVLGTGDQTKDYLYVDDVVDATLLVATKGKLSGEAYNAGSGRGHSVREVVGILLGVLGLSGKTKVTYTGSSWKGDVQRTEADPSRLRKIGFMPKVGIEEGMRMFVRWYESEYGRIG